MPVTGNRGGRPKGTPPPPDTPAAEAASQPTGQEVAKRQPGPAGMVAMYAAHFARVLPSHIKADTWVRVAQGALQRGARYLEGPKDGPNWGKYQLEVAAANNSRVFLATMLDAARLGLEPGTEHYYLTPRRVKLPDGSKRLEILGIVGYQGYIELMYRAGAISSVVAEVVRAKDTFSYSPSRDDVPEHEIDWDAEDRGALRLVYAYARLKDGGTSRVVVLNRADIARIKASSEGATSEYSPWRNHEEAMWLKSAVRQLRKWVPTSPEFRREELRAQAEAANITRDLHLPPPPAEFDFVDGEVVDDPAPTPDGPDSAADAAQETQQQTGTLPPPEQGWPDVAPVPNGEPS